MNLGVEGILFMGGAAGLGGAFYYEKLAGANASPFVALLLAVFFAFLAGALASLLFSFITITLRANQNVTGLALTIFGTGTGQFLGEYMRVQEGSYVSLSNNRRCSSLTSCLEPNKPVKCILSLINGFGLLWTISTIILTSSSYF